MTDTMKHFVFLVFILALSFATGAQQTVGLTQYSSDAAAGYVLFSPINTTSTYLIDRCGHLRHTWTSDYTPGLSCYLLEDGSLLRTGKLEANHFGAGGNGGFIELRDWLNNPIWQFEVSDSTQCQHHDVCPLPNGNILVISWDLKTPDEAINAGRNTALVGVELWSEKIMELHPIGSNEAEIVWEWRVWDHLVQEFDDTKPNYQIVSEHPERVNLNFVNGAPTQRDWLHINSVDYRADLDQIVLSVHNFSEVWIIDHSTTTAEAASTTGGNSGKGGDLLYRWGNPRTYNMGTASDQILFGQHHAHWMPESIDEDQSLLIFNNGLDRPNTPYTLVEELDPPMGANGHYTLNPSEAALPVSNTWQYPASPNTNFYASNISGAYRTPNGHLFVTHGPDGVLFEVDQLGNTIWSYTNPISGGVPFSQGEIATNNRVFKAVFYPENYPAFATNDLVDNGPLELNSTVDLCLVQSIESNASDSNDMRIDGRNIHVQASGDLFALDMQGRMLKQWRGLHANETIALGEELMHQPLILRLESISGSTTQRIFVHE